MANVGQKVTALVGAQIDSSFGRVTKQAGTEMARMARKIDDTAKSTMSLGKALTSSTNLKNFSMMVSLSAQASQNVKKLTRWVQGTEKAIAKAQDTTKKWTLTRAKLGLESRTPLEAHSFVSRAKALEVYQAHLEKLKTELSNNVKVANRFNAALLATGIAIKHTTTPLGQFAARAAVVGQRLETLGNSLAGAGYRLSIGLTLPLLALNRATVGAARAFESSFAGIRKTVDATEEEFRGLSDGMRELAKTIPISVNELNRIGELAGQLGIPKDEIIDFTRTIAELGVTTNLTTENAATSIARFANILQEPLASVDDKFSRIGSAIVGLGNNFETTESEIVDFALRIAGAGAIADMSVGAILGIGTALSSVGVRAEAGGTAIQKAILRIEEAVQSGNKNLRTFAETAGMTADEFSELWERDAGLAFTMFVEGLHKNQKQVHRILKDVNLANERTQRAFLGLSNAGDLLSETIRQGTKDVEENKAITEEANKRYETFDSHMLIFKGHVNDAGVALGNAFLPPMISVLENMTPLIDALAKLGEMLDKLPTSIKTVVVLLLTLAAVAGPILFPLGALVTGLGAMGVKMPQVAAVTGRLNAKTIALGLSMGYTTVQVANFKAGLLLLGKRLAWLYLITEVVNGAIKGLGNSVFLETQRITASTNAARDVWEKTLAAFQSGSPQVMLSAVEKLEAQLEKVKARGREIITKLPESMKFSKDMDDLKQSTDQVADSFDDLDAPMGRVRKGVVENTGKLKKLTDEYKEVRNTQEALERALAFLKNGIKEAGGEFRGFGLDVDALRQKLEELKRVLNALESAADSMEEAAAMATAILADQAAGAVNDTINEVNKLKKALSLGFKPGDLDKGVGEFKRELEGVIALASGLSEETEDLTDKEKEALRLRKQALKTLADMRVVMQRLGVDAKSSNITIKEMMEQLLRSESDVTDLLNLQWYARKQASEEIERQNRILGIPAINARLGDELDKIWDAQQKLDSIMLEHLPWPEKLEKTVRNAQFEVHALGVALHRDVSEEMKIVGDSIRRNMELERFKEWASLALQVADAIANINESVGKLVQGVVAAATAFKQMKAALAGGDTLGAITSSFSFGASIGGLTGSDTASALGGLGSTIGMLAFQAPGWGALVGVGVGLVMDAMKKVNQTFADGSTAGGRLNAQLQAGGGELAAKTNEITAAITDTVNSILDEINGTFTSFTTFAVQIRDTKEGIKVWVGKTMRAFGEDVQGAINYAVTEVFKRTEVSGVSDVVKGALENFVGETVDQLNADLSDAITIDNMGLTDFAIELRDQVRELDRLLERALYDFGAGAENVLLGPGGFVATFQDAYNQAFNIEEDQGELTRRRILALKAQVAITIAQLLVMKQQLLAQAEEVKSRAFFAQATGDVTKYMVDVAEYGAKGLARFAHTIGQTGIVAGLSADVIIKTLAAVDQAIADLEALDFSPEAIQRAIDAANRAAAGGGPSAPSGPTRTPLDLVEFMKPFHDFLATLTETDLETELRRMREQYTEHIHALEEALKEGDITQEEFDQSWEEVVRAWHENARNFFHEMMDPIEEAVRALDESDLETALRHIKERFEAARQDLQTLFDQGVISSTELAEALALLDRAEAAEVAAELEGLADTIRGMHDDMVGGDISDQISRIMDDYWAFWDALAEAGNVLPEGMDIADLQNFVDSTFDKIRELVNGFLFDIIERGLRNRVEQTEEGSKERADAEQALYDFSKRRAQLERLILVGKLQELKITLQSLGLWAEFAADWQLAWDFATDPSLWDPVLNAADAMKDAANAVAKSFLPLLYPHLLPTISPGGLTNEQIEQGTGAQLYQLLDTLGLLPGTSTQDELDALWQQIIRLEPFFAAFGISMDDVTAAFAELEAEASGLADALKAAIESSRDIMKELLGTQKTPGALFGAVFQNVKTNDVIERLLGGGTEFSVEDLEQITELQRLLLEAGQDAFGGIGVGFSPAAALIQQIHDALEALGLGAGVTSPEEHFSNAVDLFSGAVDTWAGTEEGGEAWTTSLIGSVDNVRDELIYLRQTNTGISTKVSSIITRMDSYTPSGGIM